MWADMSTEEANDEFAKALATILVYLSTPKAPTIHTNAERDAILRYINNYGISNISIMGKKQLDRWLIPTLKPVPRLVESILGITSTA